MIIYINKINIDTYQYFDTRYLSSSKRYFPIRIDTYRNQIVIPYDTYQNQYVRSLMLIEFRFVSKFVTYKRLNTL